MSAIDDIPEDRNLTDLELEIDLTWPCCSLCNDDAVTMLARGWAVDCVCMGWTEQRYQGKSIAYMIVDQKTKENYYKLMKDLFVGGEIKFPDNDDNPQDH